MASIIGTHDLKHELFPVPMSKEELHKALRKLAESSHFGVTQSTTICYDGFSDKVKIPFMCARCGRRRLLTNEDPNIIKKYDALAQKFVKIGYKARVSTYCNDCIFEDSRHIAQFVFSFQADGMEEPSVSFPNCNRYDDSDYLLALDFLRGADSASVLSDIHEEIKNYKQAAYERIATIVGNYIAPLPEDIFDEDDGELPF
ncbi:MAG: hypothetical protein IJQ42_07650 [Oscillospiraceae bacterium]|nr:hypothetical protein [Oscillospiraceae bacterium]